MKRIIKIVWIVGIALVISGYFSTIEAISVVPSIVKLSIPPGESKGDVFEIHNGGEEEVYVEISFKDWILKDNTRKFAEPGTHSRSLCKWITLEEESFTLGPKQKRTIRYTIDVPENAKGGYWGLVCFNSRPLTRGKGIRVASQLVSFVAVEVEGTLKKELKITQISAENVKDKGVRLKAELKNLGNVPLFQPSPVGKFKIKDKDNNIIAQGKLEGLMILPNEKGEYTSEYFKLDKGKYETTVFFDYGGPKLIGKKIMLSTENFYNWKELQPVSTK